MMIEEGLSLDPATHGDREGHIVSGGQRDVFAIGASRAERTQRATQTGNGLRRQGPWRLGGEKRQPWRQRAGMSLAQRYFSRLHIYYILHRYIAI